MSTSKTHDVEVDCSLRTQPNQPWPKPFKDPTSKISAFANAISEDTRRVRNNHIVTLMMIRYNREPFNPYNTSNS